MAGGFPVLAAVIRPYRRDVRLRPLAGHWRSALPARAIIAPRNNPAAASDSAARSPRALARGRHGC